MGDSRASNERIQVEHRPIVAAARPRSRFWIETGLGALSAVLFTLTLVVPDWIEAVFRIDPDRRNGSLEVAIVATLALTTLVSSVLVHRQLRRPRVERLQGDVI
jgi:hypothetical protein